jgi:uncharacterized protein (DUF2147 family)
MKKRIRLMLAVMTLCLVHSPLFAATTDATGLWKTIDDVTGRPKAVIQITEAPDHTLQGAVIKIFPRPGYDQHELCIACKGKLHNQQIVGMMILNGLKADKDKQGRWRDGEILDPHNGKTYRCMVRLKDGGKKMKVRGYIGLPLFGRSQVWERAESAA